MEGQGIGFRVPVGQYFSRLYVINDGSVAYLASYTVGAGALSPGVKRLGLEADRLFV
jgi:hypothetical protein